MSSPSKSNQRSQPPPRRSSWLLLQDEPTYSPFAPKGHGALVSLIRNRSTASLQNVAAASAQPSPRLGGGGPIGGTGGRDEEEGGTGPDYSVYRTRDEQDDELGLRRGVDERRMNAIMNTPQMRSMRLIGNSNPRYRWERYWKTEEQLKKMKKPIRKYYERTNYLIQQYRYIDRLLDSSLPHDLLNEYNNMPASAFRGLEVPATIGEEPLQQPTGDSTPNVQANDGVLTSGSGSGSGNGSGSGSHSGSTTNLTAKKVKRTPKDIYRPSETTPLFSTLGEDTDDEGAANGGTPGDAVAKQDRPPRPEIPWLEDDEVDSSAHIVTVAIYVNFAANAILLAGKIAVIISVSSVSVLASLVDALLDFLSTAIVWTTTSLIAQQDQYRYPVGRRRLEPLGVLVFSVIMITSFVQVALEAIQRLASPNHEIIELGIPAIAIMLTTILIKGVVWFWCRLVKNSSVQALASDASTDVIFNAGSIAFPIVGFYAKIWWLDALGGLLLSFVVIYNWSQTSSEHIKQLSGFSATADQRNILLYLTMRFAKTIKQIQGLQAYHAGDKLNVEVDIVLDASTPLKDSHDLAESLQYVLESVPIVDRAFVHVDYASYNLPTHMQQQAT